MGPEKLKKENLLDAGRQILKFSFLKALFSLGAKTPQKGQNFALEAALFVLDETQDQEEASGCPELDPPRRPQPREPRRRLARHCRQLVCTWWDRSGQRLPCGAAEADASHAGAAVKRRPGHCASCSGRDLVSVVALSDVPTAAKTEPACGIPPPAG